MHRVAIPRAREHPLSQFHSHHSLGIDSSQKVLAWALQVTPESAVHACMEGAACAQLTLATLQVVLSHARQQRDDAGKGG